MARQTLALERLVGLRVGGLVGCRKGYGMELGWGSRIGRSMGFRVGIRVGCFVGLDDWFVGSLEGFGVGLMGGTVVLEYRTE